MLATFFTYVQERDQEAAARLYRAYWALAVKEAQRVVGDRSTAEDCAAQAFINLFDHLDKVEPAPCPRTKGYLIVVVRNVAYREYNRRRRWCSMPEELEQPGGPLPDAFDLEEEVERRFSRQEVSRAMGRLSQRDADLLALVYGCEYTAAQCGALLGLSPAAAQKAIARARGRLRKELEQNGKNAI